MPTHPDRERGTDLGAEQAAQVRVLGRRLARDLYRIPGVFGVLPARDPEPASVLLTERGGRVHAEVHLRVAGPTATSVGRQAEALIRAGLQAVRLPAGQVRVRLSLLDLEPTNGGDEW